MTELSFNIDFDYNGLHYTGRVSPEKKDKHGKYISWHVVLNEIFFGYLTRNNDKWTCSEWRPQELTGIVGECITANGIAGN